MPLDPISIGGAILGGLFGGQSSTQTQSANREPWGPAQDLLKSQIYNTGQLQNYYQQNPFSPMQQAAYRNAFAQNDSMRAAAPGVLQRLSSNQYFDRSQPLKMPQAFDFAPKANDSLGLNGNSQALSPLLDSRFSNPYTNGSIKAYVPPVAAIGPNTVMPAGGQGGQGGDYASTSTPDYATAYSLAKMTGSPALMGYVTDGILGSSNSAARAADAMASTTESLAQGYDGPGNNRGGSYSAPTGTIDPGTYEGGFTGKGAFGGNPHNMGGGEGSAYFGALSPFAGYVDDSNSRLGGIPIGAISTPVSLSSVMSNSELEAQMANSDGGDFDGGAGNSGGSGNNDGGRDAGTGGGFMAKGGPVTARDVKGPNPAGPDDGFTALDIGEYVIKKSAVNKYGAGLLNAINQGKLPAKALRGLL